MSTNNLVLEEYMHECADGDCTEWGVTAKYNGEVLGNFPTPDSAMEFVLNQKFNVEVDFVYED